MSRGISGSQALVFDGPRNDSALFLGISWPLRDVDGSVSVRKSICTRTWLLGYRGAFLWKGPPAILATMARGLCVNYKKS
jgi:hypothetical protein